MNAALVSYFILLIAGTGLTVAVGAILRRSGQAMLEEAYPGPRAAGLVRLVTVGFYLVALGVLAVISTVDVPVDGVAQAIVTKLGVVLLILGAVYGITLMVLSRLRDARRVAELDEEFNAAMRAKS
jgi:uncharacterized membrane protein YdfJ with MMPL/SSD domain